MTISKMSRRVVLGTGAALLGNMSVAKATTPTSYDPRLTAEGQIRMEATLDGSPAVWGYSGMIYAVLPAKRPVAILSILSANTNWASHQADDSWHMTGALVSLFCDPNSKAFLDEFDNPFTGKKNAVAPNTISGGVAVFPANGGAPHVLGKPNAGQSEPNGFGEGEKDRPLGRVEWRESADTISLLTDHAFNVLTQPQLEARTIFVDRRRFFAADQKRIVTRFTTTTITPWLSWMDMQDSPGHLVWHCSGQKYFSTADLPARFRKRAGRLLPSLEIRASL